MLNAICKLLARVSELHAFAATVPLMLVASRAPAAKPAARIAPKVSAAPRSAANHWHRIADLVEDGITSARRTAMLHTEALTQLDAAEFALSKIVADLSAVMTIPAIRSSQQARPAFKKRLALAA